MLCQMLTSSSTVAPPLDLATLEAQALARHPAIQRAAAEVDAARSRASQMGAWSNPVIGGSAEELRPRESPSGSFAGFVQQTIPLGGKRSSARALGNRDVEVAQAALVSARQRVAAAVREQYYGVLVADERVVVTTRLSDLAAESAVIAKQLFNVGMADQPDVLTSEAEAARARADLAVVVARRASAWQQLASAVADPSLKPQPLTAKVSDALRPIDRDATLAGVLSESGMLQEAARASASARAAVDVERRVTRPDLFVRADAGRNRELSDGRAIGPQFGVEAGISIPLFNRNRGGIAAATARVVGADAFVEEVRLDLANRFTGVFAEYEGARATVETYRSDVLPRVERAYQLQLAKYREMAAGYPAVLQAQRTLFQMTEQYLNAIDRAWMASSSLRSALAIR